jgi:Ca2+-binding EF-hand superfamily protein
MRLILAIILSILPVALWAEVVSKTVAAKIGRDAQGYIDGVSVLIEGFGTDGAIDRRGLENVVALARAEARALAFRRLQGADLDGDGAIAGHEAQVTAAAVSAVARGRLLVNFAQADDDGDGEVSVGELQAYANGVALEAFSAAKAQDVMAVLGFDGDGDGRVSVAEVTAAVTELALSQGAGREIHNKLDVQDHDHGGDQPGQQGQPARGDHRAHLGPVPGEHDKGDDGKAEL